MADFLLSIKGIVPPEQSVSLGEAPDAAKAIPKQPEVTTSTDMSPSTTLDNWDGFKALESAFKNFVDIINQSGLISNSKLNAEMKKISSQFDVGAAEQKLGSFRDTSVNESKTGTMLDAAPIPEGSYIIKEGDTASQIAADNLFTLTQLKESNPHIEDFDNIEVGQYLNFPPVGEAKAGQILVEEEAVQVPSVTAEQRTALSSMDEITKSQGTSIINNGNFSLPKLKTAVNNSIKNSKKKAMLSGIVDIEVGTDGPVSENRYTESNVNNLSTERFAVGDSFNGTTLTTNDPMVGQFKHEWRRRLIRDGVMDTNGTLINYSGTNVFNSVYANRMGNGDYSSGDGDRFRGRGLVQITGRDTYQEVQNILQAKGINIDLINEPELVNDTRYALPAALAYLEYAGLTDDEAENMSARSLQKIINPSADVSVAEDRWDSAIRALRTENPTDADSLEKRNEYAAQRRVGFRGNDIDGIIGTNSDREMRRWLTSRNVNIPANATGMDLVVLVNSQP